IAEAAARPSIRSVPLKTEESQTLQNFHRIRDRLLGNRIALSNQIRGILYEYDIKIRKGDSFLLATLVNLTKDAKINSILKMQMADLYQEFIEIQEKINRIEGELQKVAKHSEPCQRLMEIPGVGPLIATAVFASVSNAAEFRNGRQLAAWLGLVP